VTTAEIESLANRGGSLATADFDIGSVLRYEVIPDFLTEVGEVSWRRKTATVSITVAGGKVYNLPDDFLRMVKVYLPCSTSLSNSEPPELPYIGDDPILMARAAAATVAGSPSGYFITPRAVGSSWRAISLDVPPSSAGTLICQYIAHPQFTDDVTSVDMDPFIPAPLQAGLVAGLRAEIFYDRYGEGDPRYVGARAKFDRWAKKAQDYTELGHKQYAVFVR
jgi:hypothetical protein